MWEFDHLAVVCGSLDEGVAYVERAIGAKTVPGGKHPRMGTWNQLMSLGPKEYLEVIAIDPNAPVPVQRRWFGLDDFSGAPKLGSWVCRCADLEGELAATKTKIGATSSQTRGEYAWLFAVPFEGRMPFEGAHPALMQWQGPHPAAALPDRNVRLDRLIVSHPDPDLKGRLNVNDPRIEVRVADEVKIEAELSTARGPVWLS